MSKWEAAKEYLQEVPQPQDVVLYLGVGHGTAAAKLCKQGIWVVGVDVSKQALERCTDNIPHHLIPLQGDARLQEYQWGMVEVDWIIQDISQKNQADILCNHARYLKEGGYAVLFFKGQSVDVTASVDELLDPVRTKLQQKFTVEQEFSIDKTHTDHWVFVLRPKPFYIRDL